MKLIHKNLKNQEIKLEITSLDDLWDLYQILNKGDQVSAKSFRKIKIGSDENAKQVKKPVYLTLKVEKVEFNKFSDSLKILGTVTKGPEFVPTGSHHSFNIELGSVIDIVKEKWYNYQLERIDDALNNSKKSILICVLDREEATIAQVKKDGFKVLAEIKGNVKKKNEDKKDLKGELFYIELGQTLQNFSEQIGSDNIILASPAFWKDDFMKIISKKIPSLKDKMILSKCNYTGIAGIKEVLKRPEIKKALAKQNLVKELNYVEEVLRRISIDGNVAYGYDEVKTASEIGAIETLLVLDSYIHDLRLDNKFNQLEEIMKNTENANGKLLIVSEDNEAGRILKGLGKVAALTRFKLPE